MVLLSLSAPVQSLELRWVLAIGTCQKRCCSWAANRTDSTVDEPSRNCTIIMNVVKEGVSYKRIRCVYFLADPSALIIEGPCI